MKRFFLIISLIFACTCAWAGGIDSAKDLEAFIQACNNGEDLSAWMNADTVVVLTADIDLSKVKKLPQVQSFSGIFDGQGHSIQKWKATAGLFAQLEKTAIVRNLRIDASCSAKLTSKADEYCFGFIADRNEGMVIDCVNEGSIAHKCGFTSNNVLIGGLVGMNRNVILRCSNSGKLTSEVTAQQIERINVALGGILGGSLGKLLTGSTVARCTNDGAITLSTDAQSAFVGGIVGIGSAMTVKYCVNRGPVKGDTFVPESGSSITVMRTGGIAGQVKSDILRCDNFGSVTGSGVGGANVGGIVGMPHAALVIADCVNYGTVTAMGEMPSHTGGIAGNIGRPVHIYGCINNGKVSFEGVSARNRSTAGGIVGQLYVPKSQNAAAYVRGCINHGPVNAGSGGNKYDASNNNCIHAAGIVGFAVMREDLLCYITDCSSDGKVNCPTGRKGNICAFSKYVILGGDGPADWAAPATAAAGGNNVSGTVKTSDGKPLQGILVTDGRQYTKTAADGSYAMKSNFDEARFIYLSIPAGAVIPTRAGLPQCYKRIPRYTEAITADFVLDLKPAAKDYTVLMIADPQVRPYGMDGSMEAWHEVVAPDAEAFRAGCPGEVYSINLGDLVYNYMYAWDDYLDGAAKINCPTFNVIGNHDYDQANLFETEQGNVYFETYVGPEHYSFDLGDIHYIVLNTILYDRPNVQKSYHYGLDDRTLAWLEADLSYVPKDKVIMTCSHHNPFKTPNTSPHGSHNVYSLHYEEYLALVRPYKAVYAWNGHNHQNYYYNYANHIGDTRHGAPNIQSISVARATGALRLNKYLASKGEPQGYMVMEVHGDDVSWYYKSVGKGKDYQMKLYAPARTGDGSVMANIWNWSEGWSTPEWYENGVKVGEMTQTEGIDPDYQMVYDAVQNQTTKKYCKPGQTILWKATPTSGASSGEVRVSDMFGNVFTQTINL